jgi:hypothetical protein
MDGIEHLLAMPKPVIGYMIDFALEWFIMDIRNRTRRRNGA